MVSSSALASSWRVCLALALLSGTARLFVHADHTVLGLQVDNRTTLTLHKPISDATVVVHNNVFYLHGGCDSPWGNQFANGFFSCASISNASYAISITLYNSTSSTDGRVSSGSVIALLEMPTPRYRHAAVAMHDLVLLVGGRTVTDELIATVDVYNVTSKDWTTFDLDEAYVVSDLTGFAFQDRAYFCGGYNETYIAMDTCFSIEVILNATNATTLFNVTELPPMPTPRGDLSSITYGNYALVTGGFSHENNFCAPLATVERLYIPALTWTEEPLDDLTVGRGDKVLVRLDGDDAETAPHIYALGGERQLDDICEIRSSDDPPAPGEETILLDDVERYNVTTDMWQVLPDLPAFRFRFAAVGVGNIIYTFGGQYSFNETCQCFPTSNEVTLFTEILAPNDTTNGTTTSGSRWGKPRSTVVTMIVAAVTMTMMSMAN